MIFSEYVVNILVNCGTISFMKDYIVLDLEWNQAARGKELKTMPFEIIEIGAVRLDENKNITDSFDSLIHPKVYKTMHSINTMITNITMEELKDQEDFPAVYDHFMKWCGDPGDFIFCTWGDMDLTELQRNIDHFGCTPLSDGPVRFLDIQKLYSIYKGDPKEKSGLEGTVNELCLKSDIPFHRAINDVSYTAQIFKKIASPDLEKKVSYNLYHPPADKESEIHAYFDSYSKYVTRCFGEKSALLHEKDLMKNECYICKNRTRTVIDWFCAGGGKTYLNLSRCPEHGLMRSVIRIKKSEHEGIYAIKITHSASDEDVEQMQEKIRSQRMKDQKSNLSNSEW